MPCRLHGLVSVCLSLTVVWSMLSATAAAQTVWSGLTYSFERPDGVEGTLPEHQDAITPNVVLARGLTAGLYNASSESSYGVLSPEFTEWATGLMDDNDGLTISATNYGSLTFTTWTNAYLGAVGNNIIGENAVVHLIFEDVYLDIQFTSWAIGRAGGQGGFAYLRSEPPVAAPTGDYNGDLVVNAADYTLWRNTLGQTVANAGDGADGDESGEIDAGDYDFWKSKFGDIVPPVPGAGQAVPEPATALLFVVGLVILQSHFTIRRMTRN